MTAATALYLKVQHLESLEASSSSETGTSDSSLRDEIVQTFVILINALLCLKESERWIVVDKLTKTTASLENGNLNTSKKVFTKSTGVTRVALKLSAIKKEYEEYEEQKLRSFAQSLSFIGS